jgi:predicted phosphoribosyltransferase
MMLFKDREHAARLLAQRLAGYRGQRPLVLGIPRGAVPMAKIIAAALDGELDVVLVHKLGAPGQPELAIGSVDEAGHLYLSDDVSAMRPTLHGRRRLSWTPCANAAPCIRPFARRLNRRGGW